ncbi:MAG TPA: transposase [bacterium]|nr:transposase [bacterium]
MRTTQGSFKAEEKLAILKSHFLEKVAVSELCEKHGLQGTQFYQWQKYFFENGAKALTSDNKMKLPPNTSLPFFAYGIFKPGQLCFFRIKDFVKEFHAGTVNGSLKERDGIPLLITDESGEGIKGHLIHFRNGEEESAYNRIVEIEPDEVYQWKEVKVNKVNEGTLANANALIGRRYQKGSSDLEHEVEWDGINDPLFKQGIEEISKILEENSEFDWDYKSLFRLEMGYMLLWSAIERYAGLKYHFGKEVMKNVHQVAAEKKFADSLHKNVKNKRDIFSTNLDKYTLDTDDPKKSIDYYYQVRSNAVHRGKGVERDFEILKTSLEELLAIFNDLLDEAFPERRKES